MLVRMNTIGSYWVRLATRSGGGRLEVSILRHIGERNTGADGEDDATGIRQVSVLVVRERAAQIDHVRVASGRNNNVVVPALTGTNIGVLRRGEIDNHRESQSPRRHCGRNVMPESQYYRR